jgi:transcription antitermination factor NusG
MQFEETRFPSGGAISKEPWFAVYTRHQHEKTVDWILTTRGFETFVPLYKTAHQWKDRIKHLSLPLFPCYVFLRGDLRRRLDIISTPGVHALVSNAGVPAPIPPKEIEAVRRVVESGVGLEPHPFLKCGVWVRVKAGPLVGLQGILVRKKSVHRLVLSVEMLGKSAAVEVDALLVEKLNDKLPTDSTRLASLVPVASRGQTLRSGSSSPIG